ncbi:unnamed protein product [Darwinula stevensoni]|uniref:Uncharacterized protein n=1 Tax=Darwinula stevensoni TaxID=69355 RepID=A0A7R9FNG1_9CRUS|nr:unnamed protein product [Darwinula stevensoni]CAG0896347.1 unnamed protein product [Darwinula stevensoni]
MMISCDGFRHDYLSLADTPHLDALRENGVYVAKLKPIFPSITFVNHQAIATGLYAETHGILANDIIDSETGELVNMFDDGEKFATADPRIIPIWVSNEEAASGRYSGVSMWAGGQFHWGPNEAVPTHLTLYDGSVPWEERVDLALSWFVDPDRPANFVVFYLEEPDSTGHDNGPESPEVKAMVEMVDALLGYLVSRLEALSLLDGTNLVFLSDHGMLGVNRSMTLHLDSIPVPPSDYWHATNSPLVLIYPLEGKEEEVYQGFLTASMTRPFTVYKTENSPEEWHYGPTPHSPPFYIVADKGYTFSDDAWLLNIPEDPRNEMIGVHGYNNSFPEMQAYFVAYGPAFKQGYVSPEDFVFNNIDVYPLLCHLLGIQARPNNGTLEHSLDFLVPTSSTGHSVRDSSSKE